MSIDIDTGEFEEAFDRLMAARDRCGKLTATVEATLSLARAESEAIRQGKEAPGCVVRDIEVGILAIKSGVSLSKEILKRTERSAEECVTLLLKHEVKSRIDITAAKDLVGEINEHLDHVKILTENISVLHDVVEEHVATLRELLP